MYKILTLNKISPIGTDCFDKSKYTLLNEDASPDGVILRSFDMHSMELPESLLAAARAGAGVNNIPIDKCTDAGVVVFNTPGANANAVKELVLCSLFLSSRKINAGVNWAQSLKGQEGVAALVEKGKGAFVGPEVMGKTLGVVGLGAIGALVANAAVALGMEVIGYDPFLSVNAALRLDPSVKITADLDVIVKNSDYITMHLPLNKDTKYMFNEETFAKAKKGLRLLNFSRGELVCNDSVKKAVEDGSVACYVIDFPTEDILGVENIITVPHLGASTPESEENCAYMAAKQLIEYIEHGNIINSVNFPNCRLDYSGKKRVCVLGKGFELDKVLSAVTGAGHKIAASASKAMGALSYAIVDVEEANANDLSALSGIEGVIKYRVI